MPRHALAVALLLATTACSSATSGARTPVARRAQVGLALDQTTLAATDTLLAFTLRLTNPEPNPARLDFTGEPPFTRGLRDKLPDATLWYTIERDDRAGSSESIWHPYTARDTVLGAGESLTVPVQHSLRAVGVSPGPYRIRGGIGAHVSGWVTFTVTK
jgi:hypothetical protein